MYPYVIKALRMVERKSPASTYVVSRWFLTNIVSEMLKSMEGVPPPPVALEDVTKGLLILQNSGQSTGSDNDSSECSTGAALKDSGNSVDGASGAPSEAPTQSEASTAKKYAKKRAGALKALAQALHSCGPSNPRNHNRTFAVDDVHDSHPQVRAESLRAAKVILAEADSVDVTVAGQLQDHLSKAQESMQKVLLQVEEQLQRAREMTESQWLTQTSIEGFSFKKPPAASGSSPLTPKERASVERLREFARRLKMRQRVRLGDGGSEIDVEQHIANVVSRTQNPSFKTPESDRGIRALFLLDRSNSMSGTSAELSESATVVLSTAFNEPTTKLEFWGFYSSLRSTELLRYDKSHVKARAFSPPEGGTPLHVAVRVALRSLSQGSERKILFVLTDGAPTAVDKSNRFIGDKDLFAVIGKDIASARRHGIQTVGIIVGSEVSDENASKMFNGRRHWTRVKSKDIDTQLVRLFTESLKHAY